MVVAVAVLNQLYTSVTRLICLLDNVYNKPASQSLSRTFSTADSRFHYVHSRSLSRQGRIALMQEESCRQSSRHHFAADEDWLENPGTLLCIQNCCTCRLWPLQLATAARPDRVDYGTELQDVAAGWSAYTGTAGAHMGKITPVPRDMPVIKST